MEGQPRLLIQQMTVHVQPQKLLCNRVEPTSALQIAQKKKSIYV